MSPRTLAPFAAAAATLIGGQAFAQPMTVDEFRRELVGLPLCGTPTRHMTTS